MSDHRDLGAQPERTRLAWRRTALAATITALLGIRYALSHPAAPLPVILTACIALTWLGLLIGVQYRIRRLAEARPPAMASPWPLLAATVVMTISTLTGLLIVADLLP